MFEKRIYYSFTTKSNYKINSIAKDDFDSLFNDLLNSISEKNNDAYIKVKSKLYKLLFSKIDSDLNDFSRIIIYPDEKLFFLPFMNLNEETSTTNIQEVKVIKSYESLAPSENNELTFQGYGVRLNLPGS